MLVRNRVALVAATALTCAGLVGGPPATADTPKAAETPAKVTVITTGLEGPRQLSLKDGYFYVAESDAARVTRVRRSDGSKRVALTDIPHAQGATRVGSKLYATAGESAPDDPGPAVSGGSRVYVAKPFAKRKTFADTLAYELKYNPDNQTQLDSAGKPLDALSNPYFVIKSHSARGFLLVADAGGNDVLAVSKKGKLSTFFVPPVVTTGVCATNDEQNSPAGPSCDPVPTGLAYGPGGNLYVSGISALAPGEGRVYVVDKNGKLIRTLTGLSNTAGVAVGPDGSVYVSDLLQGAPTEEAAAARTSASAASPLGAARTLAEAAAADELDLSTIGQIVKIAPDGKRTYAQVPMPSGLLFSGGKLYASTWAIAVQGGLKAAGRIVSVDPASFVAQ